MLSMEHLPDMLMFRHDMATFLLANIASGPNGPDLIVKLIG